MRARTLGCIANLLFTASAAASDFGASAGIGVGSAYDGMGAQLQLRFGHLALLGAIGPANGAALDDDQGGRNCGGRLYSSETSWALGLRWYHRGEGSGLYLGGSLVYDSSCAGDGSSYDIPVRRVSRTYAAIAGWRFRWGPLYFDAGAGPAFTRTHRTGRDGVPPGNPGFTDTSWQIGGPGDFQNQRAFTFPLLP